MSVALTKNIKRGSIYSQGGLSRIIAFNTFQPNGLTPTATYADGVTVDGIIETITLAVGTVTYVLEFDEDKASFSQNLVVGASRYIKQQIDMVFSEVDTNKNAIMKAFDLGKITFAVKTKTGKNFILGKENGMVSEKNDSGSGTASGDLNGYTATLVGAENGHAVEITEAAWSSLAAVVAP